MFSRSLLLSLSVLIAMVTVFAQREHSVGVKVGGLYMDGFYLGEQSSVNDYKSSLNYLFSYELKKEKTRLTIEIGYVKFNGSLRPNRSAYIYGKVSGDFYSHNLLLSLTGSKAGKPDKSFQLSPVWGVRLSKSLKSSIVGTELINTYNPNTGGSPPKAFKMQKEYPIGMFAFLVGGIVRYNFDRISISYQLDVFGGFVREVIFGVNNSIGIQYRLHKNKAHLLLEDDLGFNKVN